MQPFEVAERYIQLRKQILTPSWAETLTRMSSMVLMPLITIFLFLVRPNPDIMMIAGTVTRGYSAWREWIEYHNLRFEVQKMFLQTALLGGPTISSSSPEYLPYVFAHTITAAAQRRP